MTKRKEIIMKYVFAVCAGFSILAVLLICIFIFSNGVPAINEIGWVDFLTGTNWRPSNNIYGILPMIVGSIYVTGGAILLGVPIGVLTAIFMAYYADKKLLKILKPAVSLLAGIPSIVYGLFGLCVIVPLIRDLFGGSGTSLLASAIVLAIMILPTVITVSENAIKSVPRELYEGSLALGATHDRSVFFVVLPAASSGVLAAIILGVGRAVGETMAVIMVAGNQAVMPDSIVKGLRTLTANIVLEMGYAADLHRGALIGTAVILFTFILIINLSFAAIKGHAIKKEKR